MDAALFDFKGLSASGRAEADGDIAFDEACVESGNDATLGVIRFAEAD